MLIEPVVKNEAQKSLLLIFKYLSQICVKKPAEKGVYVKIFLHKRELLYKRS